jgi:SAM-dependent methyltransferase
MCNAKCILFGAINLDKKEIAGKKVIEIGAFDVNGSLRTLIQSWKPASYIGVDIEKGKGVDVICKVEDLIDHFGLRQFDVVLATEVLEHVRDWRRAISNIKKICRANGVILITTRSQGFGYHAFPHDFWRYDINDMVEIFGDCQIVKLERDDPEPGVLLKAKIKRNFVENDLSQHQLFSIILERRCREVDDMDIREYQERYLKARKNGQRVDTIVSVVGKIMKLFP